MRRASPPAAPRTARHPHARCSTNTHRPSPRSPPLPARREDAQCGGGAHCAGRTGAAPPTGRRRVRRRRRRDHLGARALPARLAASIRPRPQPFRPRAPRTGREAGSPAVRASRFHASSIESPTPRRWHPGHRSWQSGWHRRGSGSSRVDEGASRSSSRGRRPDLGSCETVAESPSSRAAHRAGYAADPRQRAARRRRARPVGLGPERGPDVDGEAARGDSHVSCAWASTAGSRTRPAAPIS